MSHHTLAFPFRHHALAIALTLATGASNAATINVSGACTLVNAINNANSDTDTDGAGGGCPAGSGADTLELTANATYSLTTVNNNTGGENGLPVINSTITMNGNGATIDRPYAGGATPYFRLLHIAPSGNLTLKTLTLTGGKPSTKYGIIEGAVGGILNQGVATLINSTVSRNSGGYFTYSTGGTGGIENQGSMTLINSTVSDNGGRTGGIKNSGDMTITNSNITKNSSLYGFTSAISNLGNMSLTNSSISRNSSGFGVVIGGGNLHLTNCTISDNSALTAIAGGTITLTNSAISGNYSSYLGYGTALGSADSIILTNSLIANSGRFISYDCRDPSIITLQGVNFIADGSCGAPISGDPLLSALLDNGGITLTKALQTGSPAINAADSTLCPKTDQRNVKRPPPNFNACDIGAFERTKGIPASVTGIVQFFDTQVASGGGVTGTDSGDLAPQQLDALRNQLLTAGHDKQQHLPLQACAQLARTAERIDPDNTPDADDYVTGDQAQTLADKVTLLRSDWLCK